ncbi:hypothetical protein PoB_005001000 [Plakobranchus ocellatus]|uniref:Uncharacterized protein n=1 Tax=Plakobranchus ocellatus TaxID=259542 RepID=A0AAV4BWL8_9GAST|nr:hypothetical protein PoB_005001000 [Plakobranchus ocellatus]
MNLCPRCRFQIGIRLVRMDSNFSQTNSCPILFVALRGELAGRGHVDRDNLRKGIMKGWGCLGLFEAREKTGIPPYLRRWRKRRSRSRSRRPELAGTSHG